MANIPGTWCPLRGTAIQGVLATCNDDCALYIKNSKLPPEKSCSFTLMGVWALQKIIFKNPEGESVKDSASSAEAESPKGIDSGDEQGERDDRGEA